MGRQTPRTLLAVIATLALVGLGACSGTDDEATDGANVDDTTVDASPPSPEPETPILPVEADLDALAVQLEEVGEVEEPTAIAARSGTDDLYVAEQGGKVRRVSVRHTYANDGTTIRSTSYRVESGSVVDLSGMVRSEGEQGLLGLVFSSDGRTMYVDYTDDEGATHIDAIPMSRNDRADRDRRRELMVIPQPFPNHNGGQLAIGPDGFLYIGMGDGGGAGDPEDNGQDPGSLLGSILRIDPDGALGEVEYTVPAGNPFVLGGGAAEVWLYGVRNPWRFSFDSATGDMWVADVGQNEVEEITWLPAKEGGAGRGANLGWNLMEGTRQFSGDGPPEGHVGPIHTYPREGDACAVTGGYVYRGEEIPALRGAYVYGDFCSGEIRAVVASAGTVIDERSLDLSVPNLTSFGEDRTGQLWALSKDGGIFRIAPAG